jgi:hypothetical protein
LEQLKMATQVRETSAGKSISAWVILNKKGVHVATVNAHYSNGGRVSVDVWNTSAGIDSICKRPDCWAKLPAGKDYQVSAWELFGLQQSRAGGYGYDKFAAALSGLIIDGHTMADHCGQVPEAEKARTALMRQYVKFHDYSGERTRAAENGWDQGYWNKRAGRIGASFANYSTEKGRFDSLHFTSGLDRLRALGYQVIQAI